MPPSIVMPSKVVKFVIEPPVIATLEAACVDIVPKPEMSVFGIVDEAVMAVVPVPLT